MSHIAGDHSAGVAAKLTELGAKRVEIRCDVNNERSRRVAESVGYTLEAELRNNGVDVFGKPRNTLVFSLLASQEFGVPRVVARVNDPRNGWLFTDAWGVDEAVSTPSLLAAKNDGDRSTVPLRGTRSRPACRRRSY